MILELLRNVIAFFGSIPFRLVPRRWRFRFVLLCGAALTPLVGRTLMERSLPVVGSARDEALRIVFRALTRMRVPYEAEIECDVDETLLPAMREGSVVMLSAHFPLNALLMRWLLDRGHRITGVRENRGRAFVWGTAVEIEILPPSQHIMVQMRKQVAGGRSLLLAIDRARPSARPLPAETRFGQTNIATPVFAFAEKLGLPVFFYGVRATKNGPPILTVRRIPADPAAFTEEFRRHAESMLP
jgi:hypothetical protein